ncbi:MAG: tetratricopeptide repeat protein [bacterium]
MATFLLVTVLLGGCAKYNTFFNANRAFRQAEEEREDMIKERKDVSEPTSSQQQKYEEAIRKCQKVLDEYSGSSLTDDALFLMSKSYHRLNSYRMSIRKIDLLFANYPATPFEEEAIYLQALNYLLIGDIPGSSSLLERLDRNYPESRFQAEVLRVSGENSYVLEEWEVARASFTEYLEKYPDDEQWDDIAFKRALCSWELFDYQVAGDQFAEVTSATESRELGFDSRLLRARTLCRVGQYTEAADIVTTLSSEAELYQAQGKVTLVEAESLFLQGRDDEASPLLENMPQEWRIGDVDARANDLLGWISVKRWDLERAREHFQTAVKGAVFLEDPDATRNIYRRLQDYLAAEQSLDSAQPDKIPGLKLLQANSLLFGMDRPRAALDHYFEVLDLAETDSATAARALYGAMVVYQERLDLPDSAAVMINRLRTEYPRSAQAYQLEHGKSADLLSFLLDRREAERRQARLLPAAAEDSAAAAVDSLTIADDSVMVAADSLTVADDSVMVAVDSLTVADDSMTVATDPMPVAMDSLTVDSDSAGTITTEPVLESLPAPLSEQPQPTTPDSLVVTTPAVLDSSVTSGGEASVDSINPGEGR